MPIIVNVFYVCFKSLVFGIKSLSFFALALTPLFCWAVWRVSVLFEFVHLSHSFPNMYWIINMCFAIIVVISQLCIFFFALCLSFCFFSIFLPVYDFFFLGFCVARCFYDKSSAMTEFAA